MPKRIESVASIDPEQADQIKDKGLKSLNPKTNKGTSRHWQPKKWTSSDVETSWAQVDEIGWVGRLVSENDI